MFSSAARRRGMAEATELQCSRRAHIRCAPWNAAGGAVELILSIENDAAVVSVRDSGVGFESALSERLFEPFVQHEQGRDRSAGGLGLGLAIAAGGRHRPLGGNPPA